MNAGALQASTHQKDVVTQALVEYIQRRKQLKLLDLFGTVDFEDDFDTKVQRGVGRTPSADL